ncbi:MAG TPA: peptide ligase PGM1-related protein [Casimicrobiaceae bacterium]|nr:peptide ligase PGM1-related protein [Casimicrobiaceae bacterium]
MTLAADLGLEIEPLFQEELVADHEYPRPGSAEERIRFAELQRRLTPLVARVFPDRHAAQTVVVIPSMSLPREELLKLTGANHYEERLLCLLMLLRQPRTNVVYVTSQPIADSVIDYYLHLLPGIPFSHARRRLTLLSCYDSSRDTLTEKVLARPRLIEHIRAAIGDDRAAHMTCFSATPAERTLAVRLGIPLYACDPDLRHLGSKSGGRELMRRAGVAVPLGYEDLTDERDIAAALFELQRRKPGLRRAVIKLNEGFSGEGNAIFSYDDAPATGLTRWIASRLAERTRFEAAGESWERYSAKFAEMGGIVEEYLEGDEVRSPSVQCRVDPLRHASIISTHDQLLGGPSGQIYLGCTFPADTAYSREVHDAGLRVARALACEGVIGRFGVDFVSVRKGTRWETTAIEINLRKGGTTHPFLMLQYLTDGVYDPASTTYHTATGRACYYYASDNLQNPAYVGLTPDDLIEIAVDNDLHFDAASQEGVVFHLIGALSEYGKLGTVCIGDSRASAERFFHDTVAVLNRETGSADPSSRRYDT